MPGSCSEPSNRRRRPDDPRPKTARSSPPPPARRCTGVDRRGLQGRRCVVRGRRAGARRQVPVPPVGAYGFYLRCRWPGERSSNSNYRRVDQLAGIVGPTGSHAGRLMVSRPYYMLYVVFDSASILPVMFLLTALGTAAGTQQASRLSAWAGRPSAPASQSPSRPTATILVLRSSSL